MVILVQARTCCNSVACQTGYLTVHQPALEPGQGERSTQVQNQANIRAHTHHWPGGLSCLNLRHYTAAVFLS
jgi:hypothetical protein